MGRRVVTLTTDYGGRDGYAAALKGVILSDAPDATVVDVTHEIAPGDVLQAAWVLATTWRAFPEGTIHLAVVDPEVGSPRRGVAIAVDGHVFVGPDNGLFTLVIDRSADGRAYELTNRALWRQPPAPTFHGRDIFAPVAAALARGMAPEQVGTEVRAVQVLPAAKPTRRDDGSLVGHIVHVDRFGNCVTDLAADALPAAQVAVRCGGHRIDELVHYYAEAPRGRLVALVNSSGYLEVARRDGSAAEELGARRGDEVVVTA
ncbi:MAG: SAM hydrolase/SAM-dependent halogenase family protein [Candidatus Limnocylindria bacterium]